MKLIDGIIPHTDKWIQSRLGKITSSHLSKIFVKGQSKEVLVGVGGLKYIDQKIGEILTQLMFDDVPETEDILRGLGNEQFAIERYEEITGIKVYDSRSFEYNAIASGTTDGQTSIDGINIDGIIEAKSPRPYKHLQICAVDAAIELKKIDPQYYHQCQGNILFAEANHADFISYNDDIKHYDLQVRIIRLYPDLLWRKDFEIIIEWIATYMSEKIEKILKTHERNMAFRTGENPAIEKLKQAFDAVKNITA